MGIEYVSLNNGKTNGAEGNSPSAPARFDAYTEVKNYYDKVKKDPSARVYSDTYKAVYGEYNKQKSQYYLKSCQDLLDEYNAQVQKFSGDQWKSGDEMIQSIQSAQKIKNKADILMGDISKNKDMFVQTYGQDVYDAVLGGFKDISKSTNNLLNYERDMTGVYKQFDSKEAYDRHVTLSKSPSADIQKQIDELTEQIEDEQKKAGIYAPYGLSPDDFFPLDLEYDYDFDAAEKTLTELTSYLNNARKRELAEKYKIDADSLSYSEMKKELESSARRNPEKYDYLKQYYDSMGESYWADRQAEEFVSGLSDEAKELYKQASEVLRKPGSVEDRVMPYLKRQIMEKTGIGEEELEDNLSFASRYFNAENRKDTQEKIVSMVNEHPVLNSVLLNLPTPVMNLIGGISAFSDQTLQTISNQVSGKDTPIDTNTAGQAIYNISNDIRSATLEKIAEIKQPSLPKALGGQKIGVFAYNTLMSGVDSLVSMGVGGLAGLGAGVTGKALNHTVSAITGVIMGSNAAAGTVQDSLAKGYGNWQSLGRGFASGLAEALTEHIGTEVMLDAIIKGGGAGKAILKSALSEGTEEVANNVLNGAVDWVFNGHEGRVTSLYKKYLSEGYTEKTAMSKAWEDVIGEDAGTFLSAAITGAVFGASGTAANSVYESETVKQIQNSIDNQIGGAGQANFLRGIQSLMKEAEAAGTNEDADAIRTHAVNAISDRITWILDNADSVSQNSVMLRRLGEEKVNADAAKMRKNAETLTAVRDSIKNGTYDSDFADYLIDINDSSVASDALESSSGQKRIKKAAETYMRAYNGNVSAAMDALFNTQKMLNDSEKSLTAEKNNLSKSLASENAEAAKKSSDRIAEIDSELKKISLEKKNASELMAYAQKTFARDVKNMLGKSAPNVKMDYTMKKEEEAKYNRTTGQISVNPYAILLAQSQMDTNARSNAARVKVVHEAGHAAAQADASFVPQVYAVYRELRDNGLVTDVDVNESNIMETYRNAGVLNAYLNTPSVQKQISSLVNSGMSESAARDAMVQAYMQEEYVMNFLEYVEKSGGKVYERLLPDQKNVFVRAMQKIAELFRRIAAKIKGTDTSAAGKLENTAERILAAVREFAGDAGEVTASQEAETVQEGRNTGEAGNASAAVSVASDGGERLSLADSAYGKDYKSVYDSETLEEGGAVYSGEDIAAYSDGNGGMRFSLSTYERSGRDILKNYLSSQVSDSGITEKDAGDILSSMDEIFRICKEYEGKYDTFGKWSRAEVVIDENTGRPVFSVIKPNGEYAMNLDFSLVCKKRRALDAVLNRLVETGKMGEFKFSQEEIVKINRIIKKYGFEIACDLCFVDAKRYRQAGVADSFVSIYNRLVRSMATDGREIDYFNFGGDSSLKRTDNGIDKLSDDSLDFSMIDKVMSSKGEKTVEYKVAKHLKENPSDRKLLSRGDFMSTNGFDAVKRDNPEILSLYNSKKGSGGPKAAFSDVQYLNDILSDKKFERESAYDVGGVRIQSFSDYIPRLVFDYVQMVGDLAAKRLPAHAYTKEPLFAKQFGLTGVKINMSLIPAVGDGKYAGLNADGSYAWAKESFPVEEAFRIQSDREYGKNVGTIAVGVSDQHIWKLLSDPNIRMVIPYHKSGINPVVAKMTKIDRYTNYTGSQNTRYSNGKKLSNSDQAEVPDFNQLMHRDGMDAVSASKYYVEWCEKHGYLPKFDKFAYVVNENGERVFN